MDGGYISSDTIVAMAERGIDLVGPDPSRHTGAGNRQKSYAHRGVTTEYESAQFRYDAAANVYWCPQGRRLTYDAKECRAGTMHYRYKAGEGGLRCVSGQAVVLPTHAPRPLGRTSRTITRDCRLPRQDADGRSVRDKTRSQIAEFPNLWIKTKLGLRQFRVRGLAKVCLESLWAALTYNIQHWIRLTQRTVPV